MILKLDNMRQTYYSYHYNITLNVSVYVVSFPGYSVLHSTALQCSAPQLGILVFSTLHCTVLYPLLFKLQPIGKLESRCKYCSIPRVVFYESFPAFIPVSTFFARLVGSGRQVFFMQLSSDLARQHSNMNDRQNHFLEFHCQSRIKVLKNLTLVRNKLTQSSQIQSELLYYSCSWERNKTVMRCSLVAYRVISHARLDLFSFYTDSLKVHMYTKS